jgi:hypothetical protein
MMKQAPTYSRIRDIQTVSEAEQRLQHWQKDYDLLEVNIERARLLSQDDILQDLYADRAQVRSTIQRIKARLKELRYVEHEQRVAEAQARKAEQAAYGSTYWRDTARHWLRTYAQHPPTCAAARGDVCDCNLDKLLL